MTLMELIASTLEDGGFRPAGEARDTGPSFQLSGGIGVVVRLSWSSAIAGQRDAALRKFEALLAAAGLSVESSGDHLYVPELDSCPRCSAPDCFAPGGCQYDGINPGKGRDDPDWEEP